MTTGSPPPPWVGACVGAWVGAWVGGSAGVSGAAGVSVPPAGVLSLPVRELVATYW